jgi:hypothetical protein
MACLFMEFFIVSDSVLWSCCDMLKLCATLIKYNLIISNHLTQVECHIFWTFHCLYSLYPTFNYIVLCYKLTNFIWASLPDCSFKAVIQPLTVSLFVFRLLTPPGTPLFPSLEAELKRSPVSQVGSQKARPTALKSRVGQINISWTLIWT